MSADAAVTAYGYLALARGDTLRALDLLAQARVWPACYWCYYHGLTRAEVLATLRRDREALGILERLPFPREFGPSADAVIAALARGRLYERLGNRERAVTAFSYVVDTWRNADSLLQPLVSEARGALARLAREPRN
jgi:tetratricopeptide (TPR) repeat protein